MSEDDLVKAEADTDAAEKALREAIDAAGYQLLPGVELRHGGNLARLRHIVNDPDVRIASISMQTSVAAENAVRLLVTK